MVSDSDATSEQVVLVDKRATASGKIAIITLNRPHARNALNSALSTALPAALSESDADPAVQAIILTGCDPAFCAGFDLRDVGSGEKKARTFTLAIGVHYRQREPLSLGQSMVRQ